MDRLALVAILGLASALAVAVPVLMWQRSELRAARIERDWLAERNDTLEQAIEDARRAAEVHRAHLARMAEAAAAWQRAEDEARQQEGGDAPVSDFLRGVVDSLR